VDRAVALGWTAQRVVVIDDDLGKSGASAVDRAGFQRLVTEISLGHVGLVLGSERSRLARSGKDWYQLLELCALSGALLADVDGVYDPTEYNDRLLLGLKGTMSEAELYLSKQRMQAGRVNKARRGELAIALPIGYWRRPSGEAALDPDEQVQAVVRLIFAKFEQLGSIQAVLRFLVENGVEIGVRARSGPDKGELHWKRPARATITGMLNSPIYAGVYVDGRRRIDHARTRPGHPKAGLRRVARAEYLAWIQDALPAYITVARYQANLERLAANRPHADVPGAVRFGPALLAGLVRCGHCRRRMTVCYHVDAGKVRTSYDCTGARAEYGGPVCQRTTGRCLDAFVTGQVLAALTPAAVQAGIAAAQQLHADRAALERIWSQRLERAAQQVERARRCYRLAEPENRLVVRQLEADWEAALATQQQLTEDWHRFQAAAPTPLRVADIQAITAAAADLPALWHAPATGNAERKHIIRAIVEEVTVTVRGRSELVDVIVHWAGGATTHGVVRRPIQRFEDLSYSPPLTARVLELSQRGWTPRQIADQLTTDAYRPARDDGPIRWRLVEQVLRRAGRTVHHRRTYPVHPGEAPGDHEWWLADLAAHLGVTTGTIHRWRQQGRLRGRQEARRHRWILHADPDELTQLRAYLDRVRGRTTRLHLRFADRLQADDTPQVHPA